VSTPELTDRLGYLLKHVQARLAELTAEALAPHGVSGRELAVMVVLGTGEPPSQQQAAARLGIDRTTMVGFVDTLEGKGLVARQADASDRRRNVVVLTPAGRRVLREAGRAGGEAERRFLAPLAPADADRFRQALRALLG
jgi:DNA-binding MarR family transcriptional regulator